MYLSRSNGSNGVCAQHMYPVCYDLVDGGRNVFWWVCFQWKIIGLLFVLKLSYGL